MEEDRAAANIESSHPDPVHSESLPSASVQPSVSPSKQPRRRIIGRRAALEREASNPTTTTTTASSTQTIVPSNPRPTPRASAHQVPQSLLSDPALHSALALLPSNYNFELPKTIHRIRSASTTTTPIRSVALQFPEGLLLFAPTISDILTGFCPGIETVILGDVTYGACCVDDYTARALGCDLLVHYGHSCLVPLDREKTGLQTLYVFVTIGIDVEHLLATIERNFPPGKRMALVGTIQFNNTLHAILPRLRALGFDPFLPRTAPLSAGEILGCTAPTLTNPSSTSATASTTSTSTSTSRSPQKQEADLLLYLGDGRFHLESIMIASPSLRAHSYRYDPYSRRLTHESYNHAEMHGLRSHAIATARLTLPSSSPQPPSPSTSRKPWGLILGTLGRQGNPPTLHLISTHLASLGVETITLLLSEVTPQKLGLMSRDVAVWVQVACPRLSIDWGYAFERPLLSPMEALAALGVGGRGWLDDAGGVVGQDKRHEAAASEVVRSDQNRSQPQNREENNALPLPPVYPMNYYAKDGLGRVKQEEVQRTVERLFEGGRMEVEVR
ncbi:MAG: Diphthamide biosynthesis protein 1 [Chrysothrix sp. TS-e1954]|nr:MAG: Diphthamide biosynthesis protein 1 [Chrysothrix sp. TS-e1954]